MLPEFCSHYQIHGHSVENCRLLHLEKAMNKESDNIQKVQDKGKNLITAENPN